jgi:hypothetical protein
MLKKERAITNAGKVDARLNILQSTMVISLAALQPADTRPW